MIAFSLLTLAIRVSMSPVACISCSCQNNTRLNYPLVWAEPFDWLWMAIYIMMIGCLSYLVRVRCLPAAITCSCFPSLPSSPLAARPGALLHFQCSCISSVCVFAHVCGIYVFICFPVLYALLRVCVFVCQYKCVLLTPLLAPRTPTTLLATVSRSPLPPWPWVWIGTSSSPLLPCRAAECCRAS